MFSFSYYDFEVSMRSEKWSALRTFPRKKGAHKFCVGGKERCSSFAAGLNRGTAPRQYAIAFVSAADWVFGFAWERGFIRAQPIESFIEWPV